MTTKEIISALRRCMLSDTLLQLAADTIQKLESENDRQKAEIERLNTYIKKCESGEEYWVKSLVERPKEMLEEFAEKVKAQTMLDNAFIDNLLKEYCG